jgi:hypothetical protein
MAFLDWLDNSGVVIWLRESPSVLAYPTILAFHTFSLALLVGMSCAVALRTLGVAASLPLAPLDRFFRLMWIGLYISVASGVLLLASDARGFLTNPVFYIKMAAVAVAVVAVRVLRTTVFGEAARPDQDLVSRDGRVVARAVLVSWLVALTAGRLTAYDRFIAWETAGAVLVIAIVLLAAGYVGARVVRGPAAPRSAKRRASTIY